MLHMHWCACLLALSIHLQCGCVLRQWASAGSGTALSFPRDWQALLLATQDQVPSTRLWAVFSFSSLSPPFSGFPRGLFCLSAWHNGRSIWITMDLFSRVTLTKTGILMKVGAKKWSLESNPSSEQHVSNGHFRMFYVHLFHCRSSASFYNQWQSRTGAEWAFFLKTGGWFGWWIGHQTQDLPQSMNSSQSTCQSSVYYVMEPRLLNCGRANPHTKHPRMLICLITPQIKDIYGPKSFIRLRP